MTVARDVFAVIGVLCVVCSLTVVVVALFFNACEWTETRRARRRERAARDEYHHSMGQRRLP